LGAAEFRATVQRKLWIAPWGTEAAASAELSNAKAATRSSRAALNTIMQNKRT
jgi:hypothetical protein